MLQCGQHDVVGLRGDRILRWRRWRTCSPQLHVQPRRLTEQRNPENRPGVAFRLHAAVPPGCPPCPAAGSDQPDYRTDQGKQQRRGLRRRNWRSRLLERFDPRSVHRGLSSDLVLMVLQPADQIARCQRPALEGGLIGTARLRDLRSERVELGLQRGHAPAATP